MNEKSAVKGHAVCRAKRFIDDAEDVPGSEEMELRDVVSSLTCGDKLVKLIYPMPAQVSNLKVK